MSTTPTSLQEIVTQASADALKNAPDETSTKTPSDTTSKEDVKTSEETDTTSEETNKKTDDQDEFGNTKDQQIRGRQLIAALNNPEQAGIVVKFLAERAGYKLSEIETKTDVKEAKKDITESLKESLGPELEYLADKIGPTLQKFLDEKLEESQSDLRTRIEKQETDRLVEQSLTEIDSIGQRFFNGDIPNALLTEMQVVQGEIPIARAGQSLKSYLEEVLFIAAGRKGVQLNPKASKSDKVERNRNDASQRLASEGRTAKPGETNVHKETRMDLKDSIIAAMEQAKSDMSKD